MLTRREFVGATTLAAAMVATGARVARAASAMTVQMAWMPNASTAGEIVALKKGFFASRNLDVTFLPGGPSANPIQELLGGSAELSIAYAPQIMYAVARGLPLISVFATYQKAPLTFYSLKEKGIVSVADWKGKRVGANQDAVPQLKVVLESKGLTLDDITIVQAQVPALMQDQVDVIASWPTNVAQLAPITSHAGGYNTQAIWDNGVQFQSNYYVARKDTLSLNKERMVNYLEGLDEGWAYVADNPDEAVQLVKEYAPAIEEDKERASLDVILGYIYTEETKTEGFANISRRRWQQALDAYSKIGELPKPLTAADVFDASILEAAKRTKR
jgi:NitT/TauT family transport system substrate-binding protein